jgi:hypothetical protein
LAPAANFPATETYLVEAEEVFLEELDVTFFEVTEAIFVEEDEIFLEELDET